MEKTNGSDTLLTIGIGDEKYGVSVADVCEVLDNAHITHLPCTAEYTKGIINVRGRAVTVVDLAEKLGLSNEEDDDMKVLVLDLDQDNELGALVPKVFEVIVVNEEQVEPPPQVGYQLNKAFVKGIAKTDEGFVVLLNIGLIFEEFGAKQASA